MDTSQPGTLEVGKRADVAVWDRDPYTVTSDALKDMTCELTIFDGNIVYRANQTPITVVSEPRAN
jgi:predicted amidohydrolase YtcJ